MGVFDTISDALSGKVPQSAATKPAPQGRLTGVSDFSTAREARANAMRAQGLDPATGDPLPTPALRGTGSGVMDAMHQHADKAHPVGSKK